MNTNSAEDEDEAPVDCDPTEMDNLNMEQAKKLYVKLRREQKRSVIYQQNLQRKMQKLKVDLDSRTEEVEGLQRTLQLAQRKYEDESRSLQKEHEFKAKAQEDRIRDYLSEVLYTKPSSSKKVEYELETVMVSFVRSDNFRYNLAFRVDGRTAVTELCNSACRYWGVSPEEYVLKTMASNKCQDEILVKQCFKQGEIAQLRLEKKRLDPTSTPTDDELKAIQPKVPHKKKQQQQNDVQYDAAGVNAIQKQHDNYNSELRRMGGAYFLLRTKNTKPSEHASKIKLRDIIIWTALVVLTFYGYWLRRPTGYDYWLLKGFEDEIVRSQAATNMTSGDVALGVYEVHTTDDLWNWLKYSLPNIVFPQNTTFNLKTHNMLLGYVAIRAQNVKKPLSPTSNCQQNAELVGQLEGKGAMCYPEGLNAETQETRDFSALQSYWQNRIASQSGVEVASRLRGPTPPWRWQSAEYNEDHHAISTLQGYYTRYDASGYMAEYSLGVSGMVDAYREDMYYFRNYGWISPLTRSVIVSFSAYNFAYDKWVSCDIIFSKAPSGAIEPLVELHAFRPKIAETKEELTETYIDYARLVIIFYIGIFVGMAERHHKIKNHKAGCWYHVSTNGICDIGCVACMLCVVIWRNVKFSQSSTKEIMQRVADTSGDKGYYSFSGQATDFVQILRVEGLMMVFLSFRMVNFFRLNRTVYLIWHTLGMALKSFLFVIALFVPTFVGFTLVAHTIYGPYLDNYATVTKTVLQFYRLLEGDLDVDELMGFDTIWAVFIIVCFYVIINYFLLNVFIAVVVDAYYVVQITQATAGDKWSTMKKVRWFVPGILVNMYQSLT
eukprot:CAMPEP_0115195544 /NCGR_PEP_ID=MMETSP0270-20121206/14633_1 /TAXON_ID=71861 /ORGANISM="Scrippsiella trochoidea, Strain CCMP3099" /LENGTH=831 /DNA_ID=CAMNT_0002608865 /DNA_START=40 /DNA_END=2531 /DNA_ORIENTATION=+